MILVLLGTHELPFYRLIKEVEQLKVNGVINEEIVVQAGNTNYDSDYLDIRDFMSYDDIEELYNEATLIITHAGTGSVITGLKKHKKVIAAPRLQKYNEHNDDHQLELAQVFEEKGHILVWNDGEDLGLLIRSVNEFKPKPFKSEKEKLLSILSNYIDNC